MYIFEIELKVVFLIYFLANSTPELLTTKKTFPFVPSPSNLIYLYYVEIFSFFNINLCLSNIS